MSHSLNAIYRVRGQILNAVRAAGDTPVSLEFLGQVFTRAGKDWATHSLQENVDYLVDKGYLRKEFRRDAFSGVERWTISLTASGLDLIQGTIAAEPGVEFVC